MVSDTYEPTKKGKQQAQQSYRKYSQKTQKDSRRLQKTSPV